MGGAGKILKPPGRSDRNPVDFSRCGETGKKNCSESRPLPLRKPELVLLISKVLIFDSARSFSALFALRFCNPTARAESVPRSDALCAVRAALCDPPPEARPRNRRPPSSTAVVPSSSAASAARCRSPPAPSADARPVSSPRPRSFLRPTPTLGESAQTAPLWLSSPTSLLRFPGGAVRCCQSAPPRTGLLYEFIALRKTAALHLHLRLKHNLSSSAVVNRWGKVPVPNGEPIKS